MSFCQVVSCIIIISLFVSYHRTREEGSGQSFFFLLFLSFCVGRSSLFFESFQSPVMDHDYLSIYLHTYSTYIPPSPPSPPHPHSKHAQLAKLAANGRQAGRQAGMV